MFNSLDNIWNVFIKKDYIILNIRQVILKYKKIYNLCLATVWAGI